MACWVSRGREGGSGVAQTFVPVSAYFLYLLYMWLNCCCFVFSQRHQMHGAVMGQLLYKHRTWNTNLENGTIHWYISFFFACFLHTLSKICYLMIIILIKHHHLSLYKNRIHTDYIGLIIIQLIYKYIQDFILKISETRRNILFFFSKCKHESRKR